MIDSATSTAAEPRPRGSIARPATWLLGPLVSPRTWLATMHLLIGLPVGIVLFTLAVTLVALGVGLLPLFLVGIPVLVVTLWVLDWCARFERGRFLLLLNERIQAPAVDPMPGSSWWQRFRRHMRTASTWRQFAYCVVYLPVGIVSFSLVFSIWSAAIALIAYPAYGSFLPRGGAVIGNAVFTGAWWSVAAALVGLGLLLAAPTLVRGLAAVESAIARALLGPGHQSPLVARVGELERSRARVVDSAAAERIRMERDLHDGAQQRLVSLAMELGQAKAKFTTDPEGARALIDRAHSEAKEALVELRDLVRGVHPPVLSDRGLDAALSGLAALSPIPVTVTVDLPVRPSLTIESIAYFVVAESLTNIAKHAHAQHAFVDVTRSADRLRVLVRDDGVGGADPNGQGLSGLADRVAGVDGTLAITSPAGGPTAIEVELPCAS
jgi:signal transduction histidine kinase